MEMKIVLVLIFALILAGLGFSLLGHFLVTAWETSRKVNVGRRKLRSLPNVSLSRIPPARNTPKRRA